MHRENITITPGNIMGLRRTCGGEKLAPWNWSALRLGSFWMWAYDTYKLHGYNSSI